MVLLSGGFYGVRLALSEEIKKHFGLRMYLSLAVTLAAGFILHNALLFMVFAGVVMLVTVKSRMDALCRLVILVALLPNVDQYIVIGGLYLTGISTPVVLSFAAIIACFIHRGRKSAGRFSVEDALVIVLLLCFGYGAVRIGSFSGIERTLVTMALSLGLPYFVYRRFVHERAETAHIVAALAGAAIILAFFGICEARMHWSIYDSIYTNQSANGFMSRNLKLRGGLLRAPASFSDSTAFALFALVGVFAVISSRRFFRNSLLWAGSIALTILGLLAAQSRGADLGLLFGLFLLMAVRGRYALAGAVAGGGALLVALLLALAPASPTIAAFVGAEAHAGPDQDYRQTLLRRGLQVGMEHPLLGDDMSRVLAQMADIKQGEGIVDLVNTYLTIFLNSGLLGLGLFIGITTAIFVKLFRSSDKTDAAFIGLQMFAASALGGVLFALTFTSFIYERNAYWVMMLLACCRGLAAPSRSPSRTALRQTGQAWQAGPSYRSAVHQWQSKPMVDPV